MEAQYFLGQGLRSSGCEKVCLCFLVLEQEIKIYLVVYCMFALWQLINLSQIQPTILLRLRSWYTLSFYLPVNFVSALIIKPCHTSISNFLSQTIHARWSLCLHNVKKIENIIWILNQKIIISFELFLFVKLNTYTKKNFNVVFYLFFQYYSSTEIIIHASCCDGFRITVESIKRT